jgi:hypothetical protein
LSCHDQIWSDCCFRFQTAEMMKLAQGQSHQPRKPGLNQGFIVSDSLPSDGHREQGYIFIDFLMPVWHHPIICSLRDTSFSRYHSHSQGMQSSYSLVTVLVAFLCVLTFAFHKVFGKIVPPFNISRSELRKSEARLHTGSFPLKIEGWRRLDLPGDSRTKMTFRVMMASRHILHCTGHFHRFQPKTQPVGEAEFRRPDHTDHCRLQIVQPE